MIGRITGDGNPFDAWGNGNYAVNLPHALSVVDKSEQHQLDRLLRRHQRTRATSAIRRACSTNVDDAGEGVSRLRQALLPDEFAARAR